MSKTWNERIYLTFDMDWAIDEVLDDFYGLLKKYGLVGTIHVTHGTKMLDRFRKDGILELGIHPNFNPTFIVGGGANIYSGITGNQRDSARSSVFEESYADK